MGCSSFETPPPMEEDGKVLRLKASKKLLAGFHLDA